MATVTKVPVCYKSALYCYKSALLLQKCPIECYKSAPIRLQKCPGLQKFPTLVTKVPYRVTKVPFFGYKSAHSYGSLSLSLSLSLSFSLLSYKNCVLLKGLTRGLKTTK